MKKLATAILFLLVSTTMYAQEFRAFKVGVNLGYASPSGGAGGGVVFAIEPAYRINDDVAIGLRLEGAALATEVNSQETDVAINGSYTLFSNYYLSNGKFRPLVGLGVGAFSIASATVSVQDAQLELGRETKLGVVPRVGFDLGHLNFLLEYNFIDDSDPRTINTNNGGVTVSERQNGYFSAKIGFTIGGGRK